MVLALIGMMSSAVAAPPPSLVHYQGVLLDNSNNPITGLTTLYFSIYENGLATGFPSTGTLRFRYHEDVTPDAHGVFDVQIGSTPVNIDFGTLTSAIFNTANPLYLEVSIGFPSSLGSVLLPRARFTTVGYAFTADTATNAVGNITPLTVSVPGFGQVIDATGHWTGQPISASGGLATAPKVTGIADATGGILVVGDKLTITGTNLANATATIGGKPAPTIGTPTATQLQCQVPQGIPMGLNDLVVADKSTTGFKASTAVAQLDVHRLIAVVRTNGGAGSVSIIDANTGSVIRTVTLGTVTKNTDTNGDVLPLQAGYGNNGSLLLIPSGSSNIYAIDMTSSSSSAIDTFGSGNSYRAVAVSPDGAIATACDFSASGVNQIRILQLGEKAPPYTAAVLSGSSLLESTEVPNSLGASGVVFVGDSQFVVLGQSTPSQIIAYSRIPGSSGSSNLDIQRIPSGTLSTANLNDSASASSMPVRLQITHDLTRLLLLTRSPANVIPINTGTFWPGPGPAEGTGQDAGSLPMRIAISPDDGTLFVATRNNADLQTSDRLKSYAMTGNNVAFTGETPGPQFVSTESFESADLEPVQGKLLCVATNKNHVYLSPVNGGVLPIDGNVSNLSTTYTSLPSPLPALSGTLDCLELAFQP